MRNIQTQKGKPKFSHEGYLYVFDKASRRNESFQFWRCERKSECKARLHTLNEQVVRAINEHAHGSSPASVQVAKIRTKIMDQVAESREQPAELIATCSENAGRAVQGIISASEAFKQLIRSRVANREITKYIVKRDHVSRFKKFDREIS